MSLYVLPGIFSVQNLLVLRKKLEVKPGDEGLAAMTKTQGPSCLKMRT